jgi:cob(I)alamin adenosyltransferase
MLAAFIARALCAPRVGPRLPRVKIYTRTGDDGTTGLLGPGRVSKADVRIEAYGTVDELNAAIGAVRVLDAEGWLEPNLAAVQAQLFQIGAELAAEDPAALATLDRIRDADVEKLEKWIDACEADLPALKRFILPGGTALAASLHVARTLCRRAERRVVALAENRPVEPRLVHYLNRLADTLFVLARWCNRRAGTPEHEWPES